MTCAVWAVLSMALGLESLLEEGSGEEEEGEGEEEEVEFAVSAEQDGELRVQQIEKVPWECLCGCVCTVMPRHRQVARILPRTAANK
jgi:hypothetical protein